MCKELVKIFDGNNLKNKVIISFLLCNVINSEKIKIIHVWEHWVWRYFNAIAISKVNEWLFGLLLLPSFLDPCKYRKCPWNSHLYVGMLITHLRIRQSSLASCRKQWFQQNFFVPLIKIFGSVSVCAFLNVHRDVFDFYL